MSKPVALRERDRSPKPVRSPSPDLVAKTVIVSTKTPNAAEIAEIARLSAPAIRIPLVEEIAQLKRQNQDLQERLSAFMRGSSPIKGAVAVGDTERKAEIDRLREELREKDAEIEALKQQAAAAGMGTSSSGIRSRPTAPGRGQNASLTPSKKISLIRTESLGEPPSSLRDRQSRPFAEDVEEPQAPRDSGYAISELDKLRARVRTLERENDDFKRENARLSEELNRANRSLFDVRPERSSSGPGTSDRAMALAQKTKTDLERNLEDLKIRMSNKIHELEQRILGISKKLAEITNKKMGESRSKYGESSGVRREEDSRYSYSTPTTRPVQPRYELGTAGTTPPSSEYLVKVNEQLNGQLSQLSQELVAEQSSLSQLRKQLELKEGEAVGLREFNDRLKQEVQQLTGQVRDYKEHGEEQVSVPTPTRDANIQKLLRFERENNELKTQIGTINGYLEQLKNEKVQRDIEVTNLNKTLVELRTQMGRTDPYWNHEDIIRLQSDNKMLRDTLESLRSSHNDLLVQLEKARREPTTPTQTGLPSFASETDKLKEILQLKTEVGRLKALNDILMNDKNELLAGSHVSQQDRRDREDRTEKKEADRREAPSGLKDTERKEFPERRNLPEKRDDGTGTGTYTPERFEYGTGSEFRVREERPDLRTQPVPERTE